MEKDKRLHPRQKQKQKTKTEIKQKKKKKKIGKIQNLSNKEEDFLS